MARKAEAAPPRTGALARGAITGLAAARLGATHLGQRLRGPLTEQDTAAHEERLGRILFQTLGQLRGTALKVGQLLSMDTTLLPEGVRRELARACHQALPLHRALVGRVFRQAFGREPEAVFTTFEPTAFAAASLGQVHRATIDGVGAVAVKVQYPGIATTIAADMRLLRAALLALGQGVLPLPAPAVVEQALQEIEDTLHREVDYLHEARELRWFAEHATQPGVHLPRPIDSHTRTQVLTLTELAGQHIDAWLATEPPQAWRDAAGQRLFSWFMHCAFGLGRIHADLHPGNVLFLPQGEVGILDFGCTRTLSSHFQAQTRCAWNALLSPPSDHNAAAVLDAYRALGLVSASLDAATFATQSVLLAPMQAWQLEPFAAANAQGIFDFSAKTPPPHPTPAQQRLLAQYLAGVPRELPAFDRAWLGLMHLLTRLGARVNTRNPWVAPPHHATPSSPHANH